MARAGASGEAGHERQGASASPSRPAYGGEEPIRVAAHAKVNLRLRVLEATASGYHHLETVYLRLALRDEVELRAGEAGIRLEVEEEPGPLAGVARAGEPLPRGETNLCWRAAEAYHRALGIEPAVRILLRKRLPAGAGLGGGSADAAAVLRGLEALYDNALGSSSLLMLAGELGSDVPFALADTPAALGWGRGRRLLPLPPPPTRPVLLLVPDFAVSTTDAYRWLDEIGTEQDREGACLLPAPERLSDWDELEGIAVNDFEVAVFARHQALRTWRDELRRAGARPALMAGSGSTLFGVFTAEGERDAAAERFEGREHLAVIRTLAPV